MTTKGIAAVLLSTLTACSPAGDGAPGGGGYPAAERGDQVDDYFGVEVADPYRWLEEPGSAATQGFVAGQNAFAQPRLEALPSRRRIIDRMTELWSYERFGVPRKRGGRYFFEHNDGHQAQDVLRVADSSGGEARVLIDPNTLRQDATIALAAWEVSPDGELVAYAVSDGGSDWKIWRLREVASGRDTLDVIEHVKFSPVAWSPDAAGFYYSRYPLAADGSADGSRQVSVFYHRLATPQAEDRPVYAITDNPRHNPYPRVTDDGSLLVFQVFEGYDANAVHVLELGVPQATVIRLLDAWDARYVFLGNRGRELFFHTTHQAPNGRVIAIDLDRPQADSWRQVVAEGDDVLAGADLAGGLVVASYLVDAKSRILLFELDGRAAGEIELPGAGTAGGFDGRLDDKEAFFELESFTAPPTVLRFDAERRTATEYRRPRIDFDAEAYETRQVFFSSKDGTRVPMFLLHRRGMPRAGRAPTLLYGYGGFNIAITPEFKVRWAVWLEMGGMVAVANLRGGGEYGEQWHRAGTRERKQNVFDDFIAAAEWLIAEGYTATSKLAISGRSNGGLLVGAVITQRPELFGVALPEVGVLDMLRYHTASANAHQWGSDYGWSDREEDFRTQIAYSPVHNVRSDTCYPPTLVTTADRDDRVVPWHSYKFAAALQHAQGCAKEILLRVETRAGHGGDRPTWMRIEDYADQWAFAAQHLEMEVDL